MNYLEIDSTYDEDPQVQMISEEVHDFARDVLRPASRQIDSMDDDVYTDASSSEVLSLEAAADIIESQEIN